MRPKVHNEDLHSVKKMEVCNWRVRGLLYVKDCSEVEREGGSDRKSERERYRERKREGGGSYMAACLFPEMSADLKKSFEVPCSSVPPLVLCKKQSEG